MTYPALTLALLIVAEGQQRKLPLDPDDSPFEYDVQNVIARTLGDWPDEAKADLYAQIVEGVTPDMRISDMELRIFKYMRSTVMRFPGTS